jgi:hypothetical protein
MSNDFGEIIMTLNHRDMVRTVVRADPVALISVEFLDQLHRVLIDGPANGFMNLVMPDRIQLPENYCPGRHDGRCYHRALIYITPTTDRNYIYRIGPYNWEREAWEARWVD